MINFREIAEKMILSKFTPVKENQVIEYDAEFESYPLSIKVYLDDCEVDYEDTDKIYIYRAYFNPKEKKDKKEIYMVLIVTDLSKKNVIMSCIGISRDCCSKDRDTIKFNLNFNGN